LLAEILDAGKYGPYVWGSFGCAFAVYLWNYLAPRRARAEILAGMSDA
jgi:heme exporter protein CcmD